MTRRKLFTIGTLTLGSLLPLLAWYYGFVPIFSGPYRAGIRHALNLSVLPSGTKINAAGVESWTDYIFESDISIDPSKFESYISGRSFKKDPNPRSSTITTAYRIDDYKGFYSSESWSWSERPPNLRLGDYGSQCTIYTNSAHDRIFLRFTTD